ncbi:hypothetical protein NQ317_007652 [Molorchus minor]|uniref:Amino acid transporter n=1 Tax=Molorchus minor TaxID=1323400 RepID=A0ABQ9JRG4_9CUCU|nr:hypothetical protein NQ317_007652 [Molorchus minor]
MTHAWYVNLKLIFFKAVKFVLLLRKLVKFNMAGKTFIRRNLLTILTVIGVVAGCVTGIVIRNIEQKSYSKRMSMYIAFPGDIFLRMLKCLIIPLLMSSVIHAIGSLDLGLSRKIAIRSILYYSATTISAVILGIILVVTIRPGVGGSRMGANETTSYEAGAYSGYINGLGLAPLSMNLFPPNIIQACIEQSQTMLLPPKDETKRNLTKKEDWDFEERYESTTNVLGLVVFSIVFGIGVGRLGSRAKVLLEFFEALSDAMMIITKISPVGVFFLVTAKVLEIESFAALVGRLGLYFITVLLGLFLHGFGSLSIIYFVAVRQLPFRLIGQLSHVCATAFGTASSSATMPITIRALDKMGLDPRVTRFVIPIGATINMDGTALYEAVAAIYIAQLNDISISFGQTVAVLTATAASIGAAGIPQAGLVTMVMVLDTVGLPSKEVINILAVDWLLDRFRTTINVMCDCLGAKLVDILSVGELTPISPADRLKVEAEAQELMELKAQDSNL